MGISIGPASYAYSVQGTRFPGTEIPMFFIDCPEMFDRPAFYTFDADEHRRFLLFTRAAIESCRHLGCVPDIFHVNDWHTAFLPLFLKTTYSSVPEFKHSRSVLTIHNIGYQGIMPAAAVADLGLGRFEARLDAADLARGLINPLKTGINFADVVTTVSPTYAREICETTARHGNAGNSQEAPQRRRWNSERVDYREWDPRHDPHLAEHFGPTDLRGKIAGKRQPGELDRARP